MFLKNTAWKGEESKAYPELDAFMQFMQQIVMPKFIEKYGRYEVAA